MNVASYLSETAARVPGNVAFHFEGGPLSYGELAATANRIRAALPAQRRIGLLAHRSPSAYAAVQAILSSGSAYVPMNPHSPTDYLATVVSASEVRTLVVGGECIDALRRLIANLDGGLALVSADGNPEVLALDGTRPGLSVLDATAIPTSDRCEVGQPPDDLACILFTSGSTGVPKGVRITHSAIRSYVEWFNGIFETRQEDRLSQVFDLPFDCSLHDLFVSWTNGASLVVIPDRLALAPVEYADKMGITCWYGAGSFPVNLEGFGLARAGALPNVRLSLFAGEKLTWNALSIWRRMTPNCRRWMNLYGPTETNVVTWFDIPVDFPEAGGHLGGLPIGKTLPGHELEIRRPDGSVCDTGEEGSLHVAGPQVSPGYLDPARTAERFRPRNGKIWYDTGDLVFRDGAGLLQFVGRRDFQVKIRGCRIELGEIESVMMRETGAAFVVADVLRGKVDDIVCVLPSAFSTRKGDLRRIAKEKFEPYMVPRIWKFVDSLPRTSNGKIDRKALLASWKTTSERGD